VYGPHSDHKQSVIARFIRRVQNGEQLTVYGDGHQVRDFIHVEDLCRAILLSAEHELAGEVLNIASGRETSVLDLVALMETVVGRELPVAMEPEREGEARRIAPSVEKARRLLGFEVRIPLAEGLAGTYAWFESQEHSEVPS
jgi:UDP-glucose 4-epimerase